VHDPSAAAAGCQPEVLLGGILVIISLLSSQRLSIPVVPVTYLELLLSPSLPVAELPGQPMMLAACRLVCGYCSAACKKSREGHWHSFDDVFNHAQIQQLLA
jgi:hypothetical protein